MRINPISSKLMKTTTRNLYDIKLQQAKNYLQKKMYVQQIEKDYLERNVRLDF